MHLFIHPFNCSHVGGLCSGGLVVSTDAAKVEAADDDQMEPDTPAAGATATANAQGGWDLNIDLTRLTIPTTEQVRACARMCWAACPGLSACWPGQEGSCGNVNIHWAWTLRRGVRPLHVAFMWAAA